MRTLFFCLSLLLPHSTLIGAWRFRKRISGSLGHDIACDDSCIEGGAFIVRPTQKESGISNINKYNTQKAQVTDLTFQKNG